MSPTTPKPYKVYRNTTVGRTLEDSLLELQADNKINSVVAAKVMLMFDRAINTAIGNRVQSRVAFKAGKLESYRFCDSVWSFLMRDVEFREVHELAKVDKLVIIACNGKDPQGGAGALPRDD